MRAPIGIDESPAVKTGWGGYWTEEDADTITVEIRAEIDAQEWRGMEKAKVDIKKTDKSITVIIHKPKR